jgi:hypothetical protein
LKYVGSKTSFPEDGISEIESICEKKFVIKLAVSRQIRMCPGPASLGTQFSWARGYRLLIAQHQPGQSDDSYPRMMLIKGNLILAFSI